MIYKTKGIILQKIMHTDNRMIVQVFTSDFGMKSYMVSFSLKNEKKKKLAILSPMTLVEILAEQKRNTTLEYLKDVQPLYVNINLDFNVLKTSVSLFLNEFLYKILHQQGNDEDLFDFIEQSFADFYRKDFSADFHLRFMLQMTNYLGCFPQDNYSNTNSYFNFSAAKFEEKTCPQEEKDTYFWFYSLMNQPLFVEEKEKIVPAKFRNHILSLLLNYYSKHVTHISTLKSHEVLQTILRD